MKVKVMWAAAMLLIITINGHADIVAGLVAYYPLDGNAIDASGNGRDGTVVGAVPASDRFGNSAGAMFFDGNDHIEADSTGLPTGEKTVALWFYSNQVSNRPVLVGYGGGSCGTSWFLGANAGPVPNRYYVSPHCAQIFAAMYPEEPVLEWIHIAVTSDPTGFAMYINGVPFASDAQFFITDVAGKELAIGVAPGPNGFAPYTDGNVGYFDGIIDDVRIYNRALSEQDIQELYSNEVDPPDTWNLADDWSDASNPNGVWSYNSSPGIPISTHWDDWDPTSGCCFQDPQPAWAASQWPNSAYVPMWMKVNSNSTLGGADFSVGRVIMHGVEGGLPTTNTGATWTSPINGAVTIDGGVWIAAFEASRSMTWTIFLNNMLLTEGHLDVTNPGSSVNPVGFGEGTGGGAVLSQVVSIGDEITIQFAKTSQYATFVGVDFTIQSGSEISAEYATRWTQVGMPNGFSSSPLFLANTTIGQPTELGQSAGGIYMGEAGYESPPDTDADFVKDFLDSCQFVANTNQRDTDLDGLGNICDPDLNNDGIVNFADIAIFSDFFLSNDHNTDLNGDGFVNFQDFLIMTSYFLGAPGPSGRP